MQKEPGEIEDAIDYVRRWMRVNPDRIRQTIFGVLLIVGLVIGLCINIYRAQDTIVRTETLSGTLVGSFSVPSRGGSGGIMYSVRIPSGQVVPLSAPANAPFVKGAYVEVLRGETSHGNVYYYLKSYAYAH